MTWEPTTGRAPYLVRRGRLVVVAVVVVVESWAPMAVRMTVARIPVDLDWHRGPGLL